MPLIRDYVATHVTTAATSITVELPAHETNDLLIIGVSKDDATNGAFGINDGTWTLGGANNVGTTTNNTVRAAWYWKKATSNAEVGPTITNADSDEWSAAAISFSDVDTGTPIDVSNTNGVTDSAGAPYTAAAVTTATNNAIVLYIIGCDGGVSPTAYPGNMNLINEDSATNGIGVAWKFIKTAGSSGTCDFYGGGTADESVLFTIGVRDGSSGTKIPDYVGTSLGAIIDPLKGNSTPFGGAWSASLAIPVLGGGNAASQVWQVDNDAGPTYVDETTDANSTGNADFTPFPATEATADWVAIGYTSKFNSITYDDANGTAGAAGVVVWEYWNGASWASLPNVTQSATGVNNFTAAVADGKWVTWRRPYNWTATSINGSASLYYVRARITTVFTTNPVLDQIFIADQRTTFDTVAAAADSGVNPFENASSITPAASNTNQGGSEKTIASPSQLDLKPGIVVGTYLFGTPRQIINLGTIHEGGAQITFADSSNNNVSYMVGAYLDESTKSDQRNIFAIQLDQSTLTYRSLSSPAPNLDATAKILLLACTPRGTQALYWNQLVLINNPLLIQGATSDNPITMARLEKLGNAYPIPLIRNGVAVCKIKIGGGDPVHVWLNLFSLSFPKQADGVNYNNFHVDNNQVGVSLDARSGDTCKLTNGLISSQSPYLFVVESTASSGATWDFTGLSLVNATVTLRNVTTFSAMSFTNCPQIDISSCTISGCTISGAPAAGSGLTVNSSSTITNCTINTTSVTAGNSFVSTATPEDVNNTTLTGSATTGHAIRITSGAGSPFSLVGNTFTSYGPTVFGFHTTNDVTGGTSDWVTKASHGYITGDPVRYMKQGGTANIGLTDNTTYYVRSLTSSTIAFYATAAEASSDTNRINLTATGSETHYVNSMGAAIFNDSGGAITINVSGGGTTPSIRNGSGASTTVNNTVPLTVTVLDKADNGPIKLAQVAIYRTSDDTQLMNEDTETVTAGSFVVGVKYRIVSVGTTDFTTIGAASSTVGVVFTATGVGSGTGTATNGIAFDNSFNYTSDTPIYVRIRKSLAGETKYVPVSTTGTITSTGFSVTITMSEDTNA